MKRNFKPYYPTFSFMILVMILTGCSNNLSLIADKHINGGVRLPVDIIKVKDSAKVVQIGPDAWFGDPKRENLVLEDELIRLSFSGGERMNHRLEMDSDVENLVIFADYSNQNDRNKQQIIIPRSWLGFSHTILIREDGLELKK